MQAWEYFFFSGLYFDVVLCVWEVIECVFKTFRCGYVSSWPRWIDVHLGWWRSEDVCEVVWGLARFVFVVKFEAS